MTNEPNKICEETNLQKIGNLIKIPYYDLLEESKSLSPFYINGFSITELDETNEYLYPDEDIPDIETKKGFHLKKKAEFIENYYMNSSEEELSNVHCSKCYMNGFSANELLYFKDRKSLISYLKYCFIFLKKNIFMNHMIYKNNRYDLSKIDQSYLIGFRFFIPKTICKSCFIQLINKEFLVSEIKNEISDYDNGFNSSLISPKKDLNLLRKKRNRKEKKIKNSEKKDIKENNKEIINKLEEEPALKSIQISPIVIPLSNNDTPIKKPKRKKIRKFGIKRRKKRIFIKKNKTYNENVIYDIETNTIIINKKILENLEINEDNKQDKNKIKSDDNSINIEKKEEIFIAKDQEEIKKIGKNYKSMKCINLNINKENNENNKEKIKKEKKEKTIQNKNTIIINKINNSNCLREINMNKPNLNKNNNNISNNISPNNAQIIPIYFLNKQTIFNDMDIISKNLEKMIILCDNVFRIMNENPKFAKELYKNYELFFFNLLDDINKRINENRILMEYSFLVIKKYMDFYQRLTQSKEIEIYYVKLFILQKISFDIQDKYKYTFAICLQYLNFLKSRFNEEGSNYNQVNAE